MKVSINREFCTGVGMCEELDAAIFTVDEKVDGLVRFRQLGASATCSECGSPQTDRESLAIEVPAGHEDAVREAAVMCPSEAIIIEG